MLVLGVFCVFPLHAQNDIKTWKEGRLEWKDFYQSERIGDTISFPAINYSIKREKIKGKGTTMARLKDFYVNDVAPAMMKKFGYKSVMQIPKLEKVVINVGAGEAKDNAKVIDAIMTDLAAITGQKPIVCRAKKSVANFKLREGMPIGVKVTLRSEKMYEFVDKLFNVAFPRVRDFRGISANSFDGKGNYSTGIKEQLIFPEIEYDKIDKVRGMDINFITTANTDEEARELLTLMGAPFIR